MTESAAKSQADAEVAADVRDAAVEREYRTLMRALLLERQRPVPKPGSVAGPADGARL